MSLSVTSQANYAYASYAYTNSASYTENAVDSSEVSEAYYHVSNLSTALETMNSTDTFDLNGIGNLNTYTGDLYKFSQLSVYETLTDSTDVNVSDLLSNSSDLSEITALSTTSSLLSESYLTYSSSSSSTSLDSYTSSIGSLLDTLI